MLMLTLHVIVNISPDFTTFVATAALPLAPDGGASGQFSLQDISVHGRQDGMEHDGSLSREDYDVSGDATRFSPRVFREFLSYFGGKEEVTLKLAARARW